MIMVLPAGGFLMLGFILLALGVFEQRKKDRAVSKEVRAVEGSS